LFQVGDKMRGKGEALCHGVTITVHRVKSQRNYHEPKLDDMSLRFVYEVTETVCGTL
jgi:hypothetical protein